MEPTNKPKSLDELRDAITNALHKEGVFVSGSGHGRGGNGDYVDLSVECDGFDAYVSIEFAVEDECDETEPVDPEREPTPPMNEDQADALARELEYERRFGDRELSMRVEDMEPDVGDDAI